MWESDKAPEKEAEQIIYELHVKEFSWDASGGFPVEVRGKYPAFCCKDTSLYGDGNIRQDFLSEKSRGQLCTAECRCMTMDL